MRGTVGDKATDRNSRKYNIDYLNTEEIIGNPYA